MCSALADLAGRNRVVEVTVDKYMACCKDSKAADLPESVHLRTTKQRIHAKVVIIDDSVIIVGSRNWSESLHIEVGIATNEPRAVRYVSNVFEILRPYMEDLDRDALKLKRMCRCKCCKCEVPKRANTTTRDVVKPQTTRSS